MAFAIESRPGTGHVVLGVHGDVDLASAAELREHLRLAVERYDTVVVDLDGVGFMDSTGLGVLVTAYNRARASGRVLVVARPQRLVRNALRLVQVDSVIDVYESVDEALAAG